jgi:hypothetical protein
VRKFLNIEGMVFNRLTVTGQPTDVVKESGTGKKCLYSLWPCLCSCGNRVMVRATSLIGKRTGSCGSCGSCGCMKPEPGIEPNQVRGQVYGNWKVLGEVNKNKWLCRCSCGNEVEVNKNNIRTGRSRSCFKCGHARPNSYTQLVWKTQQMAVDKR